MKEQAPQIYKQALDNDSENKRVVVGWRKDIPETIECLADHIKRLTDAGLTLGRYLFGGEILLNKLGSILADSN